MTVQSIAARLRGDPGLCAVLVGLALVIAIYAPTVGYGLVNYDDPWLVRDNWILSQPSLGTLHTIFFDFDSTTRFVLGAEYLPVRDVSMMIDFAVWGDRYGGFHLTNVVVYLGAIIVWFRALLAWGIDRRIAGVAMLVWALLPAHAESVAWLSERKGLLAALLAGVAALGLGHFRAGRSPRWLVVGAVGGALAIWSKAPAAFALAGLAGLELVLPERRASWRRSLVGLGVVGVVAAAAFVPVFHVATSSDVVGEIDAAPASRIAMATGLFGFYLRLAAMSVPCAVSYPIATDGPAAIDLVLGALGLAGAVAVLVVPRRGCWQPSAALRAGSIVWLVGWFPISRLALPLKDVIVADRYVLLPSLGLALAIGTGIAAIRRAPIRHALLAVLVIAGVARSLDARASWASNIELWARAAESNPNDGEAWSVYVLALEESGQLELARAQLERGLHTRAPRLLLRRALMLQGAPRPVALAAMREAAEAGDPKAASNLALMLLEDRQFVEALSWARKGAALLPMYAPAHRTHGKVALEANALDEALAAFRVAHRLDPQAAHRYNLGLALAKAGNIAEARPLLESCVDDPKIGATAKRLLATLPP